MLSTKNDFKVSLNKQLNTISNMTETELTMPMKFEDTNLFIIYPNPIVASKIIVSIASYY